MHARPLAGAVLAGLALCLSGPAVAARADGGGISLAPAPVDGADPAVGGMLVENVAAGGAAGGSVVVANGTAQAVTLDLYVADGLTGVTSGIVYGDRPSSSSWVSVPASTVALAAGQQRVIPFAVIVPAGASAGDHVSAVTVAQAPSSPPSGGGFAVGEVVRSVVPVDVVVSGAAAPQVGLDAPDLGTLPGTRLPDVIVPITNRGTTMCAPTLAVAVDGVTQSRRLDTILPGDAIRYPFPWSGALTVGDHHVTITATDCGASRSASGVSSISSAPGTANGQGQAAPGGSSSTPGHDAAGASGPPTAAAGRPQAHARRPHHGHRGPARAPHGAQSGAVAVPPVRRPARPARVRPHRHGGIVAAIGAEAGRVARAALHTGAFPIGMLAILVVFALAQDAIDRRDPKLALAPVHSEPDLPFDEEPLATRGG